MSIYLPVVAKYLYSRSDARRQVCLLGPRSTNYPLTWVTRTSGLNRAANEGEGLGTITRVTPSPGNRWAANERRGTGSTTGVEQRWEQGGAEKDGAEDSFNMGRYSRDR